uniref:UBP-type domain-containing protein n=1 Tax=Heterorhabditis bacteriophora TaxID=37862 RepID=A0A1I7XUW5_HETBA
MAADGGLRGGASCHHRTKKGLFKSKASVIKRLKSTKRVCDDCERLIKSGQPTPENCCSEVVICVSCGHLACNEHAKKHCEAARSGNVHPFLMELNKGIIR